MYTCSGFARGKRWVELGGDDDLGASALIPSDKLNSQDKSREHNEEKKPQA